MEPRSRYIQGAHGPMGSRGKCRRSTEEKCFSSHVPYIAANSRPKMASDMTAAITVLSRMQIKEFFASNAPRTQDECNQRAAQVLGTPVRPSVVQGATSYTVVPVDDSQGSVIQFRAADDTLDLELLTSVFRTYGQRFVPRHQYSGSLGATQRLHHGQHARGVGIPCTGRVTRAWRPSACSNHARPCSVRLLIYRLVSLSRSRW